MNQSDRRSAQPRISRFWPFRNTFYGWAILGVGVLSSFATVPTQGPIVGVFNQPIRDDLGWTATDISIGFVVGSVSGGFFSFVVGRILDKRGARLVSVIAGLVIAAMMIGMWRMQEPWHWWVLFGVARATAASGAQLSTMVSLASWWVRKRGRIVGMIGMGQRFGQAIMPLPIVAIIGFLTWREAWLALAIIVIVLLVIPSALLMRHRPEDYGLLPDGERTPEPSDDELATPRVQVVEDTWTLAEAKRTKTLWLLIAAQASVILSLNSTNLHAAAHLQDSGLSLAHAAIVTTTFAATSALTVLPWGILMERLHVRYIGLIATFILTFAMGLLLLADNLIVGMLFGLTYGLALGAWTVVSRMLFANYFGRRHFGAIRGFAAPIMASVNVGPILAGYLRDSYGQFDVAFMVFGGMFLFAFTAFFLARQPKKAPAAS